MGHNMASELLIPPSRALDANANPYAGAKWYFYQTGTLTPQSVYTTAALNVAHANPVVADAGGKFANIFFNAALTYRGVLKDASDTITLHDIDPINDGTLSQLAASGGASLVGFLQSGTGAVARTAQAKAREAALSLTDKGGIGDGVARSPAVAQIALDQAIVEQRPIEVPKGDFKYNAALTLANGLTVTGDDMTRSIISASTAAPVLRNSNAVTPRDITFKRMTLSGGTYGMDITNSNVLTNFHFEDVLFLNNSAAGFRNNKMFIVGSFTRTTWDSTNKGFVNSAANANLIAWNMCQFKEMGDTSIELLGGAEANIVYSTRFEARNLPATDTGKPVIKIQASKCFIVMACYFEDCFKEILNESGNNGTTMFIGTRFSGQENLGGGLQSERFTSDGPVVFMGNQFQQKSFGSRQQLLVGANPGLDSRKSWVFRHKEPDYVDVTSPQITVTANDSAYAVFEFTTPNPSTNNDDIAAWFGTVEVDYWGRTTAPAVFITNAKFNLVMSDSILIGGGGPGFSDELINQTDRTATVPTITLENGAFGTNGDGSKYRQLRVRVAGIATFALGGLKVSIAGRFVNTVGRDQMTVAPVLATGPSFP